jgi:hypothetical protein
MCKPSESHKSQSKVNAMGTVSLSSWCDVVRIYNKLNGCCRGQTGGRTDVIKLFRIPFRSSVKIGFACCSFYAVFWPNVDPLHLPFLYHVPPVLSSTFHRCDNIFSDSLIMYFFRPFFLLGTKMLSCSQMFFIYKPFFCYYLSKRCGPGNSVCTATGYGLHGPGIESNPCRPFDCCRMQIWQKVHQVLGNAAIRRTLCVVDVVAHRTISRSRSVNSVDTPVVN